MSELHVGREMDAAVAEAVGLVYREIHAPEWGFTVPTPCWIVKDTTKPFGCVRVENWHPSTSIADAFAALDAVMEKHPNYEYSLHGFNGGRSVQAVLKCRRDGRYVRDAFAYGIGDTRAEAICKAILALAEATT